jgi:hypothetical protein
MPTLPKSTASIAYASYTVIQHVLSGAGQFGDTAPLDDVSGVGTGPFLVFENGIWKYPAQASVGRVTMPADQGPMKLLCLMADLGTSNAWALHVAKADNASDTPYPSADAALYTEGDIVVATGTSRYISTAYNFEQTGSGFILTPGQRLYFTTAGATGAAVVRFTFRKAFDTKA